MIEIEGQRTPPQQFVKEITPRHQLSELLKLGTDFD